MDDTPLIATGTFEDFVESRRVRDTETVLRCGCGSGWCLGWVREMLDEDWGPRAWQMFPMVQGPLPEGPDWY